LEACVRQNDRVMLWLMADCCQVVCAVEGLPGLAQSRQMTSDPEKVDKTDFGDTDLFEPVHGTERFH